MGTRFGPANVQYGDWRGTVALDDPDDPADLYRLCGIDPDDWIICGLEISNTSESAAGVSGSVLAVRRDLIEQFEDWEKVARANDGAVPASEFVLREGTTMAVLGEFKRVDIRATRRGAIEDAGLDLDVVETVYPPSDDTAEGQ
jgi:hypothetical protein